MAEGEGAEPRAATRASIVVVLDTGAPASFSAAGAQPRRNASAAVSVRASSGNGKENREREDRNVRMDMTAVLVPITCT